MASKDNDVLILRIDGALDSLSVADVRLTMDALIEQGYRKIVMDVSALRMIDATGVGAIASLHRRVSADQGWVCISGARDQPLAIFRLLNFDKLFFTPRTQEARA